MNILGAIPSNGYNAARAALDPNDPNYYKKLGMIGAVEGHHELNAENTQPDVGANGASLDTSNSSSEKPNVKPVQPFNAGTPPKLGPQQAPEMPVENNANPDLMAMPQEKPAINSLWNKASAIHNPVGRTLGRIGTGILGGAEAVGEAMFPTVARNIPGSMTHANVENSINFQRQQEALRNRTEAEREQEEADYHRQMANTGAEKAATAANQGQQKINLTADQQAFQRQLETNRQTLADNHEKFQEHLGQGRLDEAATSLKDRVDEFNRLYPLKQIQAMTEEQRTAIEQEGEGIKADAEDLARQMYTTTDASKRAEAAKGLLALSPSKLLGDYLLQSGVLQAAQGFAAGAPQQSLHPVQTPLNTPRENGGTVPPRSQLKVGDVVNGHTYKGGDPSKQASWSK